jgi:hypothetical protein
LEALTGLRWFAAFGVFLFHVRDFYPLPGTPDTALFGNSGVTFFFVLSGFVLTWSFTPNDTAPRFYWRRFARIWPALAVSTALAVPVFYSGRAVALDHAQQLGLLASLTLVQAWIPEVLFAGNPAAWSLSDEAFFYALFPFLVRPLVEPAAGCSRGWPSCWSRGTSRSLVGVGCEPDAAPGSTALRLAARTSHRVRLGHGRSGRDSTWVALPDPGVDGDRAHRRRDLGLVVLPDPYPVDPAHPDRERPSGESC